MLFDCLEQPLLHDTLGPIPIFEFLCLKAFFRWSQVDKRREPLHLILAPQITHHRSVNQEEFNMFWLIRLVIFQLCLIIHFVPVILKPYAIGTSLHVEFYEDVGVFKLAIILSYQLFELLLTLNLNTFALLPPVLGIAKV